MAPLAAEDLVTLLRDCVAALGLDAAVAEGVSVHTVHYYRHEAPHDGAIPALLVPLPGDAVCVVPLGHPARHSADAAHALAAALVAALGATRAPDDVP